MENLVVADGTVEIDIAGERHVLEEEDAILFEPICLTATRAWAKSRPRSTWYLVMTYVDLSG
jgi:hypothetical protein